MPILSSGQTYAKSPVRPFQMPPGHTILYCQAGGGQVLCGGFPPTGNSLSSKARTMAIGHFRRSNSAWKNILIPTSTGYTDVPDPYDTLIGGADVADMQLFTVAGERRLAFISGRPFARWDVDLYGLFPSLGFLREITPGVWTYDSAGSFSAQQLQNLNGALGATHFPTVQDVFSGDQTAQNGGFAEIAILPQSQHFVITRYFNTPGIASPNGGFVVISRQGELKGVYNVPTIPPLSAGGSWFAAPKFVEADPTGTVGNERFFVQYDAYHTDSAGVETWHYPDQEFRFDSSVTNPEAAITPVSSSFVSMGTTGQTAGYGDYDASGNLWIGSASSGAFGFNGGNLGKFTTRTSNVLNGMNAVPANWPTSGWMDTVTPPSSTAIAETYGYPQSITHDPTKNRIWMATVHGWLLGFSMAGVLTHTINLDVGTLQSQVPNYTVLPSKGAIDLGDRSLWVAIVPFDVAQALPAGQLVPHWLYRFDLDGTFA